MIMNERRSKMAYFTIVCTIISIQFGILSCMSTSEYQHEDLEMMTWYDSAAKCSLVSNKNLNLLDGNDEGWVGGIYLNTSWMTYEGCLWIEKGEYKNISLADNSPALCSVLCENHPYIGLKEKLCACLNEQDLEQPVYSDDDVCPESCSMADSWAKCVSSTISYYSIYKHRLEGPYDSLHPTEMCFVAIERCPDNKTNCRSTKALDTIVKEGWKNKNFTRNCRWLHDENNDSADMSSWRSYRRFDVLIWLNQTMVKNMINRNLTYRLGICSENSTIGYNTSTANGTLLVENDDPVFVIQMGITLGACAMVMLSAITACCIRIKNRSEENIVIAMEGPPQHTIPMTALAENYSDPIDKASTFNEKEGPRFCATESCQNTNCQRTENGEYQHLDFTLRSEPTPRFADNNEYDHLHGRANVVSVFEQPWDTATSKVNKLFSQISKSVIQKSQNMRKSLIKRRASRSGSPKLKCRASDYCDAWKTQLNNQQFAFDSDADNQSDISIDVANSSVDSSKDGPEFRRTDSAFPVLPYSERINVKSTHIYDEPDDRRMSLRERLLHMISIRPLKMPFGIELDLRGSRSKSKIYSLATPIDETDESVA